MANGYLAAGQFGERNGALAFLYNSVYAFHMPLFFALSGYVFSLAYLRENGARSREKLLRKTADMTAVYLFWSILFGVMKLLTPGLVSNTLTVADIVRIPVRAIDHFWYLYVLIFCYLFAFLLLNGERKNKALQWALPISAAACVLCCLISLPNFTFFRLLGCFLFFLLGVCLQSWEDAVQLLQNPLMIALHLAAGFLIVYLSDLRGVPGTSWEDYGLCGPLLAYCLSAAFIGVFSRLPSVPALEFLGRNSLAIYILHNFFIALCRAALPKIGIDSFALSVIISVIVATGVPVLIVQAAEKLGIASLLFAPVSFFRSRKKKEN